MRRHNITAQLLLFVLVILLAAYFTRDTKVSPSRARVRKAYAANRALILYDEHASYDGGSLYAVVLANLLGHFKYAYTIEPAADYRQGGMDDFSVIFYIGFIKNAYIPDALFKDIYRTDKTIVWLQHNLNQLQGSAPFDFLKKYGFCYTRTAQFGENAVKNPPDFFDRFSYKGHVLDRGTITGRLKGISDISMVIAKVTDPSIAKVWATVENPDTKEATPYILQAKNIWFIADIPFTFLDLRDSYFILADILHDILGADHPQKLMALIRIEDVNPNTPADDVTVLTDFFKTEKIPFSIGVIPFFKDPAGVTSERAIEKSLADSPDIVKLLKGAQAGGASIVMHGITHQRDESRDPSLRVTSVGYEFWDPDNNSPVRDDSTASVKARVEKGKEEFVKNGLVISAYETPHYTASASDYRAFAGEFDVTIQNVTYFLYDASRIPANRMKVKGPVTEMVNQAFPYVIYRDTYGQFIIPGQTVENFEYEDSRDARSAEAKLDRILKQAEALTVVRDGCVSFYIHPYVIAGMRQHNIQGLAVLKKMIDAFKKMGYVFTGIKTAEKGT